MSIAFTSPGSNALDPSIPLDATAQATPASPYADQWGSCAGSGPTTMSMSVGGALVLSNGSAAIPFSLTLPPDVTGANGGNNWVPFTITGRILYADFANAPAGSYSANLTLTITP